MTVHRLAFAGAPLPPGVPVRLVFGGDGDAAPPADATATLVARVTRLSGGVSVRYESRTARATVGVVSSRFDDAVAVPLHHVSRWRTAQPLHADQGVRWHAAIALQARLQGAWADASGHARNVTRVCAQLALPVGTWPQRQVFTDAERQQSAVRAVYQDAARVGAWPVHALYQEALHSRRAWVALAYQSAAPAHAAVVDTGTDGVRLRTAWLCHYQQAMPVPIGCWVRPVVPPLPEPCYTPVLPVRLVFADASAVAGMPLVFVCERPSPTPEPGGTVGVPVRRIYMVTNSIKLTRVSDGVAIHAYTFGMALDADSWTWSWSATLHATALPLIQPGPGGDPVEVLATVNGTPYRLCVEQYGRQREFASTRIRVRGRGRAAILDAPYAPTRNHGNTAARTAQQLMADVLTINGVGIGWEVAFGLTDWLVPGNLWAHQGSYISALLEIAAAAGGYVQPHNTAQTLRVLPRYPAAPWQWHTLTPDFELPSAVVSVEGTEWQRKAAYNRVHVSGTTAGVLGEVTRGGTAGNIVAPMVTDALITHAEAARQRGLAVLSDTGTQAHISLRLPVLEETGVIPPGALVRYVDGATTHLGLVRATSLEWSAPTLRQTLAVETHPA